MRLEDLNALDDDAAARVLLQCCGSTRWAARMAAIRPFDSLGAMMAAGDRVWSALDAADWREAFASHPRIGARVVTADGAGSGNAPDRQASWSAEEQARVDEAAAAERVQLAESNREYEARFGYIFIVCAAGKSAREMLGMLVRRLPNDPDTELRVAADEQGKITRLRLGKLLAAGEKSGT